MNEPTQRILKALPFDSAFKEELLRVYPTLSKGQQVNIDGLLWDTYGMVYDLLVEKNTHIAMLEAEEQKRAINDDFYREILDKTDEEFKKLEEQTATQTDLDAARKAMELIIKEMKAAKMPIKAE